MFIIPVIFHSAHYHRFDVEKFLLVTKGYVLIGIVCVMLAIYLGLRLASDSKLPIQITYSLQRDVQKEKKYLRWCECIRLVE